jgi:hypothetical protein
MYSSEMKNQALVAAAKVDWEGLNPTSEILQRLVDHCSAETRDTDIALKPWVSTGIESNCQDGSLLLDIFL